MNIQNDGAPGDAPDIDIRKRMVDYAFRFSNIKRLAAQPKLTAEDKATKQLEHLTLEIFNACAAIKRIEIASGNETNELGMQHMVLSLWRDKLATESKDDLYFILCIVLTGIMLEKLDEVI